MRTNYILIDFENVQPSRITAPDEVPLRVYVFLGEMQTKIPVDLAVSLQELGDRVKYVKISGSGKNALDFHLAYWVGRLSEMDPKSYFHIVSKDKGFDPLIKHLRKQNILAHRVTQLAEIQLLNGHQIKSTPERVEHIRKSLLSRGNSKPRKRNTLKNTIASLFMKTLPEEELEKIMSELERQKVISFENDDVAYHLS